MEYKKWSLEEKLENFISHEESGVVKPVVNTMLVQELCTVGRRSTRNKEKQV
jgi:hypothetical protein